MFAKRHASQKNWAKRQTRDASQKKLSEATPINEAATFKSDFVRFLWQQRRQVIFILFAVNLLCSIVNTDTILRQILSRESNSMNRGAKGNLIQNLIRLNLPSNSRNSHHIIMFCYDLFIQLIPFYLPDFEPGFKFNQSEDVIWFKIWFASNSRNWHIIDRPGDLNCFCYDLCI